MRSPGGRNRRYFDDYRRTSTDYGASRLPPVSRVQGGGFAGNQNGTELRASCERCREDDARRRRHSVHRARYVRSGCCIATHVQSHLESALRVARRLFLLGW